MRAATENRLLEVDPGATTAVVVDVGLGGRGGGVAGYPGAAFAELFAIVAVASASGGVIAPR